MLRPWFYVREIANYFQGWNGPGKMRPVVKSCTGLIYMIFGSFLHIITQDFESSSALALSGIEVAALMN